MSNYGFNPNELIETKIDLIDKDGFHKVGEASDGGSSIKPDNNGMVFKEGVNIWVNNDCADDYRAYLISSVILKVKSSGTIGLDFGSVNGLYMYAGDAIDDNDIEIDPESPAPFYKSTNEPIGDLLWHYTISTGGDIHKDGYAMNIGCISREDISAEFIETYSGAQVHVIACCYNGEFVQFHNVQIPEISDVVHD